MKTKYLFLIFAVIFAINNSCCFSQHSKPLILLYSDSTIYVGYKLLVFYNYDEEVLYYVLSEDISQGIGDLYEKMNINGMYYIKLYKWKKKYPKLKSYYDRADDATIINHDHKFGILKRKPIVDVYYAKSIKGIFIKKKCLLINNVFKQTNGVIIK